MTTGTIGGTLGARVRELRRAAGLTQEELAEKAVVSLDIVAELEEGKRDTAPAAPGLQHLLRLHLRYLATALGVPVRELHPAEWVAQDAELRARLANGINQPPGGSVDL